MIYAVSDLHGYSPEKFRALLRKTGFFDNKEDSIYILGDVIDRGHYSAELLDYIVDRCIYEERWHFILGNHEDMLLQCTELFDMKSFSRETMSDELIRAKRNWFWNSGDETYYALKRLTEDKPGTLSKIVSFLEKAPLYACVEIGERKFVLSHSHPDFYYYSKQIEEFTREEWLWKRPNKDTELSGKYYAIIGHTPTLYFGSAYEGRPFYKKTWADIDTGCAGGYDPVILRLDDFKEFYPDKETK